MSDAPEIKTEFLDEEFPEEKVRAIEEAVRRSTALQRELERYNQTAEITEDAEFYRQKLEDVYRKVNSSQKVAEVKQAMSQKLQEGADTSEGALQTPVLKAVVVEEFDGARIWVEPESMIKGQYGVSLPSGVEPESIPVGTEVAVDPQTFEITDILERKKDAKFSPAQTEVTFSDVGGLDDIIEIMKKNIGVQLDADKRAAAEQWGIDVDKSLLMIGRPGTGKTMLAKALANEFDAEIFTINAPQLVEKFIGEGAKKIKKLYSQASYADKPAIVFIDEIDAIAKSRDEDRRHGGEEVERTMSQLLSELDGLDREEGDQNVVSIFATNKPSVLDPAVVNRCSAIEVPVPDADAKEDIFKIHTRRLPLEDGIDFAELVEHLEAEDTGRDIAQICKQAGIAALYRSPSVEDATVTLQDFQEAIGDMQEGKLGMEKDFLLADEHPGELFA